MKLLPPDMPLILKLEGTSSSLSDLSYQIFLSNIFIIMAAGVYQPIMLKVHAISEVSFHLVRFSC